MNLVADFLLEFFGVGEVFRIEVLTKESLIVLHKVFARELPLFLLPPFIHYLSRGSEGVGITVGNARVFVAFSDNGLQSIEAVAEQLAVLDSRFDLVLHLIWVQSLEMDQAQILGMVALIISIVGAIVTAVNHKRLRSKCCGRDMSMSVDIENTTPPEVPRLQNPPPDHK